MSTPVNAVADVVLDVGVCLSLEVGRARLTVREFLQLGPGSIVELDRAAGEPLDVYVNNRMVAHGEVVMVGESYGVRFADAIQPQRGTGTP
jgi:flagellar motor switch protein FliN/FliY